MYVPKLGQLVGVGVGVTVGVGVSVTITVLVIVMISENVPADKKVIHFVPIHSSKKKE